MNEAARGTQRGSVGWVRALCWTTVTLEGFDIVALAAALPTILDTGHAGIDKPAATLITTLSLVGILIGAILVGPLSDRFGRRACIMGSVAWFSVLTLLVPLAGSVAVFAGLRLLAGIGLGACMPAALTMMSETTSTDRRARATTVTMTGYHAGAVLTSLLALAVKPDWHVLFVVGGLVGLLALPVMWLKLPETNATALRRQAGAATTRVPLSSVLQGRFLVASIATWVASFMGLLLVYGLNSWLPTIMREAGYELGAALTLLLLLNVGGVVGLLVAGRVADARGIRPSCIAWFACAAVLLALLSIKLPTLALDVAVFATGVFVFSAQVLVYAWITRSYPAEVRGTALGLASGVGRLGSIVGPAVTGGLVTAGLAYPWGFYFFGLVAVLAVGAMVAVPRGLDRAGHDEPRPASEPAVLAARPVVR